jgi:DNA-binding response OmpR family regulator
MSCILLIDDEPTLRDMYRQLLMRAGYEVCEACDGGEGLQQFQTHSVDLVLTDMCLPKQDGFALLRTLRTQTPAVKIVAMSGGGQMGGADLLTRAASLGADRIIQKPIPLRDLLAMVRELLGEV